MSARTTPSPWVRLLASSSPGDCGRDGLVVRSRSLRRAASCLDYCRLYGDDGMLLTIGVVLLVIWLLGFTLLKKAVGGLIHIVLIIAVVVILLHFLYSGGAHIN